MNGDVAGRLRDALEAADYTYDGVAAALGPEAHAALLAQRDGARPAPHRRRDRRSRR